jgi:hypothetical protein
VQAVFGSLGFSLTTLHAPDIPKVGILLQHSFWPFLHTK